MPARNARKPYYNLGSPTDLPSGAPKEAVLAEFGRRLQAAMVKHGWNQSELARRAAQYTADNKFGRDNVSLYIRGITMPGPAHLDALAKALSLKPEDLLPSRGMPGAQDRAPPLDVRDVGNGRCWLKINQAVDWLVALEVMKLIKGASNAN